MRLKIRMVFQDPFASLNPRRSVGDSVAEAGDIHGLRQPRRTRRAHRRDADRGRARPLLRRALPARTQRRPAPARRHRPRHPAGAGDCHRRRAGLGARRFGSGPGAEPAHGSAGAVGLSMMFISHDLGVVGQISDRVAVMYMGRIVEIAETRAILDRPVHPYTRAADGGDAEAGPNAADQPGHRNWRAAEPVRTNGRLRLRPALSAGDRAMHRRSPGSAGIREWPQCRLPQRPGRGGGYRRHAPSVVRLGTANRVCRDATRRGRRHLSNMRNVLPRFAVFTGRRSRPDRPLAASR